MKQISAFIPSRDCHQRRRSIADELKEKDATGKKDEREGELEENGEE